MERKLVRLACLAALTLTLLTAWAQTPPAVQKVSVVPSPVNARIVLDCGAPLPALASSYAPGASATLQVEFGPAKWPALPVLPADGSPLIKDLKLAVQGNGRSVLTVALTEPVPYRIFTDGSRTVIELEKIVRGGDYPIGPETQKELAASDRTTFEIGPVDVSPAGDGLSVAASPGRRAVANLFALEHPLRLVIDVFDSTYSGRTDRRAVGRFGVEGVKIGQFRVGQPYTITRMVFDLKEARAFNLTSGPADFRVSFPGTAAAVSAPAVTAGASAAPVNKPADPPPPKTDPAPPKASSSTAPISVTKPVDTPALKTDPATPKVSPSAASDPSLTLASIPLPVKGEAKAAANDKSTVDDPPQTARTAPAKAKPLETLAQAQKYRPLTINNPEEKYTGEPISPRFKDADIRDVIMWLGETFGLNVMFDDEVKGTVTCNFTDIPWDQFLDIILRNKRLGKSLDGNVLRIASLATLTQEEADQQKLRDTKENGGPLLTKTYALSYAKAKDVMELLKARKSDRGQLVVDDRTNTIILTDTKDKLDLIEKLIEVLDTATPQVSIEARIVEATSNFVRNLGIQWGAKGIADPFYGNQTSLQFPNKVLVDGAMIPEGQVTKGIAGPLGGYAINLPAPAFSTALGFSFANVLDTLRLDVALTALESNGNGRIISTPKVVTQNNKPANVIRGRQIPVQTTANFTVTTQYINAALELRATPQITAEGTIIMDLEIQNNAADFANLVNGIPPITTQSAKTTVMVPDGGTTVIGGIFRVEDSITTERVPFLYQIPILGSLFKNFARTKQNQELLIFITPRIIR